MVERSASERSVRPVELKRATAADATRAFALFERLQVDEGVPEPLRLDEAGFRRVWLEELGTEIVFALSGGHDVGFCGCVSGWFVPGFEDALYMSAVYVAPGCRRSGVGRAFVDWLRRRARSLRRTRLVWCVQADNARGRAFSAALGARDVGERRIEERNVKVRLRLFVLPAQEGCA